MYKYEPLCGDSINHAAEKMVELAKIHKVVEASFNNVILVATTDSTVESILSDWERLSKEAAEAYHNSPEGKQAAIEAEQRKQAAQAKYDECMLRLPHVNFDSQEEIIDWLVDIQDATDHNQVAKDPKQIVRAFEENGYFANVNCYEDYKADDKDNVARWIIGQALEELNYIGAIHPIIHKFAGQWKEKFC